MVFPRAAFSEMMGWHGASDGLVEIWNGMPFFSPVWARRPTVTWLHHVHDTMWEMTLPPRLARLGRADRVPRRAAAVPARRRSSRCRSRRSASSSTGSASRAARVSVVPPGVDRAVLARRDAFAGAARRRGRPARSGEAVPVAVRRAGRVSRRGIRSCARSIVGEGYEREALESPPARDRTPSRGSRCRAGCPTTSCSTCTGRRGSSRARPRTKGWGMTLTEAAACGTPAVATRIAGPRGRGAARSAPGSSRPTARRSRPRSTGSSPTTRCGPGSARRRAREPNELTWGATARGTLEVLAAEALRRRTT